MKKLAWVLAGLYALTLVGLLGLFIFGWNNGVWGSILVLSIVVSQAVLFKSVGLSDLCKPVRPRRLLLPAAIGGAMMAVLIGGLGLSLSELFQVYVFSSYAWLVWAGIGLMWVLWAVLIYFYTRKTTRFTILKRIAAFVFVGSLAQLLATIPSHLIVSRRPGCMVGLFTGMGLMAGICVMFWSLGPGIVLLMLRNKWQDAAKQARSIQGEELSCTDGKHSFFDWARASAFRRGLLLLGVLGVLGWAVFVFVFQADYDRVSCFLWLNYGVGSYHKADYYVVFDKLPYERVKGYTVTALEARWGKKLVDGNSYEEGSYRRTASHDYAETTAGDHRRLYWFDDDENSFGWALETVDGVAIGLVLIKG